MSTFLAAFAGISLAVLATLIGVLKLSVLRFLKEWFGDTGRYSEGRRRRRDFEFSAKVALACVYYIFVLQVVRGAVAGLQLPDIGIWLTIAEALLGVIGLAFAKAAVDRIRDPYAY